MSACHVLGPVLIQHLEPVLDFGIIMCTGHLVPAAAAHQAVPAELCRQASNSWLDWIRI